MMHLLAAHLPKSFVFLIYTIYSAKGLIHDAKASLQGYSKDFLDTSTFPALPAKPDVPPMPSQFFGNVPVYGYRQMHAKSANRLNWMVMFPSNWSRAGLGQFCAGLHGGATCNFMGNPAADPVRNPENHGLPIVSLTAFEHELRDSLDGVKVAKYVEVDKMMKSLKYKVESEENMTADMEVPWGLDRLDNRIGLDGQYTAGQGGKGAHIYSIDSGIETMNPEFEGRAIPTLEVLGSGIRVCNPFELNCARDVTGHGTHTAGTVISKSFGVAKMANMHAIRVLDSTGSGAFSWFVGALDWVIAHGERPGIVTASLGGVGKLQTVRDAIDAAANAGLTVVVAAGNENDDACKFTPSYIPNALTVGSVDWYDTRSSFSNYGACIDVFAPGNHITSLSRTPGKISTMSGTSMAAPHVAGVVSLLFGRYMSIKSTTIKNAITLSSTPGVLKDLNQIGTPNKMVYTGPGSLTAPDGTGPMPALPEQGAKVEKRGWIPPLLPHFPFHFR